ncbi:MAG: hypothetical protein HQL77_16355 [Magnetococcales bacterium]|nr:hypothetical protein [Magnetococcales bacterium]
MKTYLSIKNAMATKPELIDSQALLGNVSNLHDPEIILWNAVLARTVNDARMLLKKLRQNPSIWDCYLFRAEVGYIKQYFHKKSMEPGGFGFICLILDLDPDWAANRIKKKYLRYLTASGPVKFVAPAATSNRSVVSC